MIVKIILGLICVVLGYLYYLKLKIENYWKKRGVYAFDGLNGLISSPKFLLFSHNWSYFDLMIEKCDELKKLGLKYGGLYGNDSPILLVRDPDIVKDIMVKDWEYFNSRGTYLNRHVEPRRALLFDFENEEWKIMRRKLTPTFAAGKSKMMFNMLLQCSSQLETVLSKYSKDQRALPIKDVTARLTTDIMANCAFGIACNTLNNPNEEFYNLLLCKTLFDRTFWGKLKFLGIDLPQSLITALKLKVWNPEIPDKFFDIVKNNAEYREKNNVTRNDLFQTLLQLKNTAQVGENLQDKLTMEEVAGHCLMFYIAGFDTSANTMTLAFYELAIHPDIQDKLRESINLVLEKHDGKITYEAVHEMQYLHMVLSETMRKYPILGMIPRKCTKEYIVPSTNLVIEKGVKIWVPVSALQRDPEFWPEPDKFDPERFDPERLKEDNASIRNNKMVYMPFGEGPRTCLGLKFGFLKTKIGLLTILKDYKVSLSKDTILPFKLKSRSFATASTNEIYLNLTKA